MGSEVVMVKNSSNSFLLIGRDNQLNEMAYQRAIAKSASQGNHKLNLYISPQFQVSQHISLEQMMQEKLSRERIVKMQDAINQPVYSIVESIMH